MRIQQLQYIIKIVETGSMNEAAKQLFITQPSLSNAVKDLENEMGIEIFIRNPKGITLTRDGMEFLSYARQVVEQIDLLSERYKNPVGSRELFSVSSQHYAFVVEAFVSLLKKSDMEKYELFLRETRTWEIIDDVKNFRHFDADYCHHVSDCQSALCKDSENHRQDGHGDTSAISRDAGDSGLWTTV